MGRASPLLVICLVLGSSFATYNLVTMIIHYGSSDSVDIEDGGLFFDPIIEMPEHVKNRKTSKAPFHVALTATDAIYNKWQCRIMYYWYKKQRSIPGSEMGGFTRILHSGQADNLMDEIPTVVVDPLPEGLDQGYIVLNRPWAFVQWLGKAKIEEEKYYPEENGPVTNIDPIGNSPVIIRKDLISKIAPTWMNISLKMKGDPETDKAFGWVLEMYGYAIASALHGVKHILRKDFMLQPPWDTETYNKFIIHYTYGCDYNLKGELTYGKIGEWRFDKRSHLRGPPPKNLPLPPPGVPESVVNSRVRTQLSPSPVRH
ncbi:hypothetical protein TSUD_365210 [Trifolium subterraneum]|uniref:Hydroxyproline O-arabinosyltransferase-like domain-containing protein n=1 Tax=Trifolium subterraneum TaxID=3900 RepID=A0A2Z6NM15_TRISU|nr:hypothetical protein TSUD_365210 [Trifolium subterraneum]